MMQPVIRCAPLAALVGSGVTYLLKDEFITNEAAPIASPRTCEPGPGTLTIVDVGSQIYIASNRIYLPGDVASYDNRKFTSSAVARLAGRSFLTTLNKPAASQCRLLFGGGNLRISAPDIYEGTYITLADAFANGTDYEICFMLLTTGALILFAGGAISTFPEMRLQWIQVTDTTTPTSATVGAYSAPAVAFDNVRILDLPPITPTVNVASPTSGANQTATADAIHDLDVTAANPLAGTAELRYRVLDASNYWTAYLAADGSFNLDSVSAGVPTNRITVASVWTVGVTRTIRVIVSGTKHDCYTLAGTTWTKRGAQINVSWQDTQVAINATWTTVVAPTNLISYNRVQTIGNV